MILIETNSFDLLVISMSTKFTRTTTFVHENANYAI
jgi:hypothetical protein